VGSPSPTKASHGAECGQGGDGPEREEERDRQDLSSAALRTDPAGVPEDAEDERGRQDGHAEVSRNSASVAGATAQARAPAGY